MILILISIYSSHEDFFVIAWITDTRIWCNWCSIADFSSVRTGSSPVIRLLHKCQIMLKQILLWLVVAGIGGIITYYSASLSDNFWRVAWFEKHLWSTRNWYVIIWFLIMIIGMLVLFWVISTTSPVNNIWWWFTNQVN